MRGLWVLIVCIQCALATDMGRFVLDFSFVDGNGVNHYKDLHFDPARNRLLVTNVSDHGTPVRRYHPNGDGIYEMELPLTNASYKCHFQSQDLVFMRTSNFLLETSSNASSTKFSAVQLGTYNHVKQPGLPLNIIDREGPVIEININGPSLGIELMSLRKENSEDEESSRLFKDIPVIGYVLSNKWLMFAVGATILLGILPNILSMLDPSFKERVVAAQMEAKKKQ